MRQRTYYVYIIASHSRRIYTGVTNDLLRRVWEHRAKVANGFSARYRTTSLVFFFEMTGDARSAITREKQLKNWRREKKIELIERDKPAWRDLAAGWFD
jgi:putative endonuclease